MTFLLACLSVLLKAPRLIPVFNSRNLAFSSYFKDFPAVFLLNGYFLKAFLQLGRLWSMLAIFERYFLTAFSSPVNHLFRIQFCIQVEKSYGFLFYNENCTNVKL